METNLVKRRLKEKTNCRTPQNTTVVICAAGMGTRLGIGTTKALVDIAGKPLIIRQLEMLNDYDDVRVVVGYQAENVIKTVKNYRSDIAFVFNYLYETTGVADSLRKAILTAKDNVVLLEGDILVNPKDFNRLALYDGDCLGISEKCSEEPVKAELDGDDVLHLSKESGKMHWPGIMKIRVNNIKWTSSHVYEIISGMLPMKACIIRAREINTQIDYENAIKWYENGRGD